MLVAITSGSRLAVAGDSSWLWCKGFGDQGAKAPLTRTFFAASILEHRSAKGDTRDIGVTLVYGDHVSRGVISDADSDRPGKLTAKSVTGKQAVTFTGTGTLAMDLRTFTVTGKIDFDFGDVAKPTFVPFVAKLECEKLDDLSIGH